MPSTPYGQRSKPVEQRFWEKVTQGAADECWPWTGAHRPEGYGVFQPVRGTSTTAHRLAWVLTNGPVEDGLYVCHRCDNPPCCNPQHLFLGTPLDNMRDKQEKGRGRYLRGADLPQTKLSGEQRIEIRSRFNGVPGHQSVLALDYGVSPATIYRVLKG